jgi:hypothetical protein
MSVAWTCAGDADLPSEPLAPPRCLEHPVRPEGKAEAVLKILTRRGLTTTPVQRRQIQECMDLETLDRWIDQAFVAASAGELFGKGKRNSHRAARRA